MADPTKATEYRKINDELVQVWPETVTDNISVKNYTKPGSTSAIANNDLLNTALGKLEKALDGKATSSHSHGNITNDGKVGSTAGLPLITTTNGVVTTGSFGTTAGTFCQGNDSRLSNARTPTSHAHGNITNAGELSTANRVVITDANKKVTISTITTTELGYLSGASSNLQTQINNINTSLAGGVTIKGTLGTSGTITTLPASHTKGDAYYAIAGAPNVSGKPLEAGDMVICITTGSSASDADWAVVQNNATTMVGATSSSAGVGGFVPAPAAGDQAKVLSGAGTWVAQTTNTDTKVKQNLKATSDTGKYPVLLKNSTTATDSPTGEANYAAAITVQPSTGTLSATKLEGALTGNASTATEFSSACTVALTGDVTGTSTASTRGWSVPTTLSTTGVTSGNYGDDGNTRTLAYSGTFKIPYITVDAKGRITSASTKTITLPASDNTNTTYTLSTSTANNTVTITPSSGSAQTKSLPTWASYGTSLPNSTAIAAMPDGALFLLLPA